MLQAKARLGHSTTIEWGAPDMRLIQRCLELQPLETTTRTTKNISGSSCDCKKTQHVALEYQQEAYRPRRIFKTVHFVNAMVVLVGDLLKLLCAESIFALYTGTKGLHRAQGMLASLAHLE